MPTLSVFEILFVACSMVGVYFVKKKKRVGWLFWDVSNFFAIAILIDKGLLVMLIPYIYYVYMNTTAWIEWGKK